LSCNWKALVSAVGAAVMVDADSLSVGCFCLD
jgi:hypothetical protein